MKRTTSFLFLLFILCSMSGCTTTPYEDNFGQGYAPMRHTVHNLRLETVLIKAGFNSFMLKPGESQPLGVRSKTVITATWEKNGKPRGRNYRVPNKGTLFIK